MATPRRNDDTISGPSQFSLRAIFELTIVSALIFAFLEVIGITAAVVLVLMATCIMFGHGGLALLAFGVGLFYRGIQTSSAVGLLVFLILALMVAFWPIAIRKLRLKIAAGRKSDAG